MWNSLLWVFNWIENGHGELVEGSVWVYEWKEKW